MNRYLLKIAEDLRPHQESGLSKLDSSGGVLLHHSTGSGKTRTFLEAALRAQRESPENRVLLVAPASLVSNVDKEIAKHKLNIDKSRLDVYSYEKATRAAEEIAARKYALAIADEAHRLRNTDTARTQKVGAALKAADKRLLATATANYNHLADLSSLLNITAGEDVLPTDRREVENRFLQTIRTNPGFFKKLVGAKPTETQSLKNEDQLKKLFQNYVSYYDSSEDPEVLKKFPAKTEEHIDVNMSPEQLKMYKFVSGDMPYLLRKKIERNLPLDKKEMASLNAFSTGVRQVSTGHRYLSDDRDASEYTPKVEEAVKRLLERRKSDPDFRGLVYSNFLDSGVNEYARRLAQDQVPHATYTGSLSQKEKDSIVSDYNSGKNPVLLISSSGAEGLDLKGTKLIQVMDPHFNPSKIKQVVGRGARYESHEHLPEDQRKVHVENYYSVYPEGFMGRRPTSIEKYLQLNSGTKADIFGKVKDLMRE